jgi:hypothetical protein
MAEKKFEKLVSNLGEVGNWKITAWKCCRLHVCFFFFCFFSFCPSILITGKCRKGLIVLL